MKKYYYKDLDAPGLEALCIRPAIDFTAVEPVVAAVLEDVRLNGDLSLKKYTKKFDGIDLNEIVIKSGAAISAELKEAFMVASSNIEKFHKAQKIARIEVETMPGVKCFMESRPIEKVGIYVPGGSAPLPSTLLMLAIPARIAGCKEIVVCSPPPVAESVLFVAKLCGIEKVYQIGGAQAIAAMGYGTESVPKVDKILGPGNQYVTMAKMLLAGKGVAIDMPAGPTEVLVIADDDARANFVAADLLSQAEHGPDSQVVLVCTSISKCDEILLELEKQLKNLERKDIAGQALKKSFALIVDDLDQAITFSNQYAPEHLILNLKEKALRSVSSIKNAGSVFIGPYSCEAAGDYASGTNHSLPTYGFAKSYSGVCLDSFMKKISFQKISKKGVANLAKTVAAMAEAEGLTAHKNAILIRTK